MGKYEMKANERCIFPKHENTGVSKQLRDEKRTSWDPDHPQRSNAFTAISMAPFLVLLPPMKPEAWTKTQSSIPANEDSSASRIPRQDSGRDFRFVNVPSSWWGSLVDAGGGGSGWWQFITEWEDEANGREGRRRRKETEFRMGDKGRVRSSTF